MPEPDSSSSSRQPLAERLRPQSLDAVIGQTHLLGDAEILRQIVAKKQPVSLIFWGPPGTGKTTLARIIAREVEAEFIELSAVTSGKKDVERTVLFVDEIHRFNKAQQDAFLPHVESGLITLIGATTENPSFEVITPLLSRMRVLVLQPLSKDEVHAILQRAITTLGKTEHVTPEALDYLAELSGGDARVALGNLELALSLAETVTPDTVTAAAQKKLPGYDKQGEMHYDVISAFIKSIRGSDVDAAVHYLARMLEAGEDPRFVARRMMISAAEDVGMADPSALQTATAAAQAVALVGMPEARIILAEAVVHLATAPKSNRSYTAIDAALADVRAGKAGPVPEALRDSHYASAADLGHGAGYRYAHDYEAGVAPMEFMPEGLEGARYYEPTTRGFESQITQRLARIREILDGDT